MNKFTTDDLTLNKLLLDKEVIFQIPINQRKYSWKKEQVEQYWEDIIKTIDDDSARHYLGVISLINKEKLGINTVKYEVIDGQQRLITTLLFISALRDCLISKGDIKAAEKIQENYLEVSVRKKKYPKLTSSKLDSYTFNSIVNIDEFTEDINFRTVEKTDEEAINENIIKTYNLFYNNIIELCEKKSNDLNEQLELLDDIQNLLLKIEIIQVISDNIANMFLYFDSLNSRGLQLNQMDIIRNNFFRVISEKFLDKIKSYGEIWDNLVLILQDHDPIRFLKYFMICEKKMIYQIKDLPNKYDKFFTGIVDEKEMELTVRRLIDYSRIFVDLFSKNNGISHLDNINYLGQQACHSFLMDYFYCVKDKERRNNILYALEIMNYKRIITGKSTKKLDGIFKMLISKKQQGEYIDDSLLLAISENTPKDDDFIRCFKEREWKRDNLTLYTVNKIWNYYYDNKDNLKNSYQIEYILHGIDEKYINSIGNIKVVYSNNEHEDIYLNNYNEYSVYEINRINELVYKDLIKIFINT